MKKLETVLSKIFTATQREEIRRLAQEKIAGIRLAQLRETQQVTQADAARAMGVSQAAISKLERRSNVTVAALQRYVHALGGSLEVTVVLPRSGRRASQRVKLMRAGSGDNLAR